MSNIPETNEPRVACLAIAWEIVKESVSVEGMTPEEKKKKLTNELIAVYSAIFLQKTIA